MFVGEEVQTEVCFTEEVQPEVCVTEEVQPEKMFVAEEVQPEMCVTEEVQPEICVTEEVQPEISVTEEVQSEVTEEVDFDINEEVQLEEESDDEETEETEETEDKRNLQDEYAIDDDSNDPDFVASDKDTDTDTDSSSVCSNEHGYKVTVGDDYKSGEEMVPSSVNGNSDVYPILHNPVVKKLTIQETRKTTKGNLDNKRHACVYCDKLNPNIARHLSLKHKNEIEVAKILAMPVKSKERKKTWGILVNKGDFSHNYDVLKEGKGLIIPKYRGRNQNSVTNNFPCQYCRGFYRRQELWRHQQKCRNTEKTKNNFGPIESGKRLLPRIGNSSEFHEKVIMYMKDDNIKVAVISDSTILQYGLNLFDEHGHKTHRHTYVSQKMRELGRLLLQLQELGVKTILDGMTAKNWDNFIEAVKRLGEFNANTNTFGIPSLALKVGQEMKSCAEEQHFQALKNEDEASLRIFDAFLEMYRLKWTKLIAKKALKTLRSNRYNCPKLLPLVEDVVKLNRYLKDRAVDLRNCDDVYPEFAQVCLAQVILFNRKRGGETERMTVQQFRDAKIGGSIDPIITEALTEFERKLCQTHLRVEICGKKDRRVPVLFTKEIEKNIEFHLKMRKDITKSKEHFLFAKPGNTRFPYRGCDCLRTFAHECDAKNAQLITSTKLRKQMATLAQVLNLKETSQDILATFQGHDIRIHREFYRLPEETLQVAKVSKLLHCINNGTISKYKGQDFDEIDFDINEEVQLEEESDDEETEETEETEDERNLQDRTSLKEAAEKEREVHILVHVSRRKRTKVSVQ